jgi:hypothetical protein
LQKKRNIWRKFLDLNELARVAGFDDKPPLMNMNVVKQLKLTVLWHIRHAGANERFLSVGSWYPNGIYVPFVAVHPVATINVDAAAEAKLQKVLLYSLAHMGTTISMLYWKKIFFSAYPWDVSVLFIYVAWYI